MYIRSLHPPSNNYTILFVLLGSWFGWWSLSCLELPNYPHQLVERLINVGAALGGTLNVRDLELPGKCVSLFSTYL